MQGKGFPYVFRLLHGHDSDFIMGGSSVMGLQCSIVPQSLLAEQVLFMVGYVPC